MNDDVLDLKSISALQGYRAKFNALLYRREILTQRLSEHGKCYPPLLLDRALTYEALEYDDLATFDAYTVYLLCLKRLSDEFVTDLEAYDLNGQVWCLSTAEIRDLFLEVLALLTRSLATLGATKDAQEKLNELVEQLKLLDEESQPHPSLDTLLQRPQIVRQTEDVNIRTVLALNAPTSRFGYSRREIYPWSKYEPDRNSPSSIADLNTYLAEIAPSLEAQVTELPALDKDGKETDEKWLQLGLFAKHDLKPGQEILREKSILTAIRPLDAAICDACGQDLEGISFAEIQQCDGEDCDITFCSKECKYRAVEGYHRPHIEEDEEEQSDSSKAEESSDPNKNSINSEDPPPNSPSCSPSPSTPYAPFCGNTDLHTIGRPTITSTPEWDLYFLLLTRTIAMSITQNTHPLQLTETKYLWGDFTTNNYDRHSPSLDCSASTTPPVSITRTLPFSLLHNVIQPLDFFGELAHSSHHPGLRHATPYSAFWLTNFDPWILQTLYAKFRGVANAQQSTFDGQPEIAAVHLGWCLANHSCAPNVRWTPTGVRRFVVRNTTGQDRSREGEDDLVDRKKEEDDSEDTAGRGIKAGEEVFSHYTDVRLPVRERRERLLEVLGGLCRCEKCEEESENEKAE